MLSNVTSIEVHKNYRQKYTLMKNNEFPYKDLSTKRPSIPNVCSPTNSKIRKSSLFDFSKNCFICNVDADTKIELKKPQHKRRTISFVRDPSFKDRLLKMIAENNDDIAKSIHRRIATVDLISINEKIIRIVIIVK